jgi:O-antigen/teichoic acid export membrane protein
MKTAKSATSRLFTAVYVDGFTKEAEVRDAVRGNEALSRVARGSVVAVFIYSAGVGLTYCSQLVIARTVSIDTYGVYAYVFAWMVVLAYFSALGFDVALLRFVPAYEVQRAWPLLQGVIQYAQRRAAAVGFAVIFIGVFVIMAWASSPEIRNTFLAGFALVPILAILRIRCSVVRAFGGVVSALVPDRVVRDGILIGLLGIVTLGLGWTIDAPLMMLATLVSSAAGLGCTVFAMRWRRPLAMNDILPVYDAPTWRQAAIPLVIAGATEVLMNRTGIILLGWIAATKDAGIYSLAFNIALVVTVPRVAVNTLFAPTISGLYARNDKAMMQVLVTRAASWTLCAGICIALALFIVAEPLLAWFGPGYEAGVPALRILLISQVIAAGGGSQLYVMTMTGHERSAAVLLMPIAIANAVVSAVLISPFGLAGAAIAAGTTLVIWHAAMAFFLWRRLQLLPGVLAAFRLPLVKMP